MVTFDRAGEMAEEAFDYDAAAAAESDIAIAVLIILACASVMGGSLASFFVPHLSRGKFLGVMGAAALLLALPSRLARGAGALALGALNGFGSGSALRIGLISTGSPYSFAHLAPATLMATVWFLAAVPWAVFARELPPAAAAALAALLALNAGAQTWCFVRRRGWYYLAEDGGDGARLLRGCGADDDDDETTCIPCVQARDGDDPFAFSARRREPAPPQIGMRMMRAGTDPEKNV